MSNEQKPGDPADKAADGAFGGVQSHRAGYGDDRLARLTEWLRAHPTTTLASGEGALLLAENDRLRDDLHTQDGWVQWAKGEINALRRVNKDSLDHYADARAEIDRLTRILSALREPSERLVNIAYDVNYCFNMRRALSAAVAAAEQEVGRE